MSDKANTPWVGPASKGSNSGGKKLANNTTYRASFTGGYSNSSDRVRSAIYGLKMKSDGFGTDVAKALTSKPSCKG